LTEQGSTSFSREKASCPAFAGASGNGTVIPQEDVVPELLVEDIVDWVPILESSGLPVPFGAVGWQEIIVRNKVDKKKFCFGFN
jgi:hypothetical protein